MARIAIYDSGVGGLSIYQKVVAKCPEHDYLFLSDNEAFPYGTKAEDELLLRSQDVVRRLNKHYAPDILIVACNTASTVVLPYLRKEFDFQIIGVVPAIKPAAELSKTKKIAVLATPATIQRPYTAELIGNFANDCQVRLLGSSELVLLAEDKLYGRALDESKIATILEPIIADTKIDVLTLACTHFPLLNREITALFENSGREIQLVDSGEAIANRLMFLSQTMSLSITEPATREAILTENSADSEFRTQLELMGFSELQILEI